MICIILNAVSVIIAITRNTWLWAVFCFTLSFFMADLMKLFLLLNKQKKIYQLVSAFSVLLKENIAYVHIRGYLGQTDGGWVVKYQNMFAVVNHRESNCVKYKKTELGEDDRKSPM